MKNNLFDSAISYLRRGSELSVAVKQNIAFSVIIRIVSILTSFILVPLSLKYIGKEEYGIWLTISSVVAWFAYFDLGMGNGLRNKLAECFTNKEYDKAQNMISTAYIILGAIFGSLILVFFVVNPFVDWQAIFNTGEQVSSELRAVLTVVTVSFFIQSVLKIIGIIVIADQKPAINNSFLPLANILSLVFIFILVRTTQPSLLFFSAILSASPVLIYLTGTIFLFARKYRNLIPTLNGYRKKYLKDITGLGIQFLIVQMAAIVIFTTDNMIITQVLGPAEVTPYNIAFKYFSIITIMFGIINQPLWSAYTQAYVKNDLKWIRSVNNKIVKAWMFMFILAVLMLFIAEPFYRFWVGSAIVIDFKLSLFMGIFVLIGSWNNIFVNLINATSKIRFQLYSSVIVAVISQT
ncbi:MAG: MATE family efflux transporter [Bacteroidales bacterium]|nr:MATE family efflux transporter [Bacteroidales bacterium]